MTKRRKRTPRSAYHSQKQSARKRGIGWDFTFDEWWKIWEESGKWSERGPKQGQYVMARKGPDIGPYSPDNVVICLATENHSNRQANRRGLPIGVSLHTRGKRFVARKMINGKRRHLGTYYSLENAIRAYLEAA